MTTTLGRLAIQAKGTKPARDKKIKNDISPLPSGL